MTLQEARDYFGNSSRLAEALDISRSAVSQWDGAIPEERQLDLHKLTKGRLKADPHILSKYRAILRAS